MKKVENINSLSIGDILACQYRNKWCIVEVEQIDTGKYIGRNYIHFFDVEVKECYFIDITPDILNSIHEIKLYDDGKEPIRYQVENSSENCFVNEGETPPLPNVVFNIYQDKRGFWINQESLHTLNELQYYYKQKTGYNLRVDVVEIERIINKL